MSNPLAAKVAVATASTSAASVGTWYTYKYFSDVRLTDLDKQVLYSTLSFIDEGEDTSSEKIIIVTKAISSNKRWSCIIKGKYEESNSDWSTAKGNLKTEIITKLPEMPPTDDVKKNDRLGFLKSCVRNRKPDSDSESEVILRIESESGNNLKFNEDDFDHLFKGVFENP